MRLAPSSRALAVRAEIFRIWTMHAAALVLLAAALLAAPPARADDDCRLRPITVAAAIAIAASVGLIVIREVECDDGRWEIEGWSVLGREMEVEIDARSGRIVEIEFDD